MIKKGSVGLYELLRRQDRDCFIEVLKYVQRQIKPLLIPRQEFREHKAEWQDVCHLALQLKPFSSSMSNIMTRLSTKPMEKRGGEGGVGDAKEEGEEEQQKKKKQKCGDENNELAFGDCLEELTALSEGNGVRLRHRCAMELAFDNKEVKEADTAVLLLWSAMSVEDFDTVRALLSRWPGAVPLWSVVRRTFFEQVASFADSLNISLANSSELESLAARAVLLAETQAKLGDVERGKHGAVLVKNGAILSVGFNHHYYCGNDSSWPFPQPSTHTSTSTSSTSSPSTSTSASSVSSDSASSTPPPAFASTCCPVTSSFTPVLASEGCHKRRVMHAEVHALIQLASVEEARGSEVYIIELDDRSPLLLSAHPCPQCTQTLRALGVSRAHHTALATGLRSVAISPASPPFSSAAFSLAWRYGRNNNNDVVIPTNNNNNEENGGND